VNEAACIGVRDELTTHSESQENEILKNLPTKAVSQVHEVATEMHSRSGNFGPKSCACPPMEIKPLVWIPLVCR